MQRHLFACSVISVFIAAILIVALVIHRWGGAGMSFLITIPLFIGIYNALLDEHDKKYGGK